MPDAIKAKIDEIMAKTERDPEGNARERILERLRRIRELLSPIERGPLPQRSTPTTPAPSTMR
jgi:hypothetical protein